MKSGARKTMATRELCETSLVAAKRRAKALGISPAFEANPATFAGQLLETHKTPEKARDNCPDGEEHDTTREYLRQIEIEERRGRMRGIAGGRIE